MLALWLTAGLLGQGDGSVPVLAPVPVGGGPALLYREGKRKRDWKDVLAEIRSGMPAPVNVEAILAGDDEVQPVATNTEPLASISVSEAMQKASAAQAAIDGYEALNQASEALRALEAAAILDDEDAAIAFLMAA